MKRCLLLGLTALALSPTAASAGFIGVGDFSPNARVVTYDNLGLPFVNEDPLAISSDTYTTFRDFHILYEDYYGAVVFGLSGGALESDAGHEDIRIALGTDAQKAGIYIDAGPAWTATVSFYDASNTLLATEFLGGASLEKQFAGLQSDAGLIHRIDVVDTSSGPPQNLFIKDLTTESATPATVPEPSGLVLLGIGGMALSGCRWLRRQRRSRVA
jgi:hypothetical protein